MADDKNPPIGEQYDHVYMIRGEPVLDSPRFRTRVAAYISQSLSQFNADIVQMIVRERGVDLAVYGLSDRNPNLLRNFIRDAEVADFLSSITLIWRLLTARNYPSFAEAWSQFVTRAMHEENVGYRLDNRGGVHPLVDPQFEQNRASTIAALGGTRYKASLEAFDRAHAALDAEKPDGKLAIQGTFEAVEILFKLMCTSKEVKRIDAAGITRHLKPIAQRLYAGDIAAQSAASQMLSGLVTWVDAAHNYRHGQRTEAPTPVPFELAIAMIGSGASFIRWLAQMDQMSASYQSAGKQAQ